MRTHLEHILYASCCQPKLEQKSVTGYLLTMGGGVITHGTKKKNVIAGNTTEAELLVLDSCEKQVLFVNNLLGEQGLERNLPIPVMCDNSVAVSTGEAGCFSSRTRHLVVRIRKIADNNRSGVIKMAFVFGNLQEADGLTKILGRTQHNRTIKLICEGDA